MVEQYRITVGDVPRLGWGHDAGDALRRLDVGVIVTDYRAGTPTCYESADAVMMDGSLAHAVRLDPANPVHGEGLWDS